MVFKTIQKQFSVWEDSEYSRQAAVSAVFGQGMVLELHSGTGKGDTTPPRAFRTGDNKGQETRTWRQRYGAPQDPNQTWLLFFTR